LKEDAPVGTILRGYGPVYRQTAQWIGDLVDVLYCFL